MKRVTLFLMALTLCGCSLMKPKDPSDIPTPHEQICSKLKSDIIFNTSSSPSIGGEASAGQHAQTMRTYQKSGCNKL